MSTRIVRRRRQGLVSFGVFLWLAAAIAVVSYSSTPSILLPTTLAFGVILPTTTTKTRIHIGRKTPSSSVLHQSSTTTPTTTDKDEAAASHNKTKKKKISILLLPAQFCVPADYEILWKELATVMAEEDHDFILGTTLVAPLQRTDWIKVAKQVPTRAFWDATLPVHRTLEWYFDAMEQGIATILQKEGPNAHICLIGHSIGGWVGRAYLGGLSRYVSYGITTRSRRIIIERQSTNIDE